MKKITNAIAILTAGAMALTCASCGLLPIGGGAKTEDIVDAAESFAKALTSCDAVKISKLTNEEKDSDAVADLEELFDSEEYTDEQKDIADAVAGTIEYEIDEDSVKIDKDEASVDVTFTMVDYEAVLGDGEFNSVDEALDAIKDCDDTSEVEVTFEFAKEDDEWLISNLDDKAYGKLYGFYGLDVSFMPDLASLVKYTDMFADYNYVYLSVVFNEDVSEYIDSMTFDVYLDGELYNSGLLPYGDSDYIWCDYVVDGPLDSGTYTVTVKCGDIEFASDSIEVDNTTSTSGNVIPDYIEGDVYLCTVDMGQYLEDLLIEVGYDVDLEGALNIDFMLTLGTDGAYKIEPDLNTFESNLEEYLNDNMDDQNLVAFSGVASMDDLETSVEGMGISMEEYRELLIESMIASTISNVSDDIDTGEYTISGDTISFDSYSMSDFEGTIGDGNMISFYNDYFAPDADYILEFYPEG